MNSTVDAVLKDFSSWYKDNESWKALFANIKNLPCYRKWFSVIVLIVTPIVIFFILKTKSKVFEGIGILACIVLFCILYHLFPKWDIKSGYNRVMKDYSKRKRAFVKTMLKNHGINIDEKEKILFLMELVKDKKKEIFSFGGLRKVVVGVIISVWVPFGINLLYDKLIPVESFKDKVLIILGVCLFLLSIAITLWIFESFLLQLIPRKYDSLIEELEELVLCK